MAQFAAHGNDLPLVMERMGQNMVEDECRSADCGGSIGEMKFRIDIELLIRQARQIRTGLTNDLLLQESGSRHIEKFGRFAIDVLEPLQRAIPNSPAFKDATTLFFSAMNPDP